MHEQGLEKTPDLDVLVRGSSIWNASQEGLVHARGRACMMESACANRERWQSPKSRPQIFMFLSAEPLMSREESEEMSMLSTGSLCPYSDKKNFRLSMKCTCIASRFSSWAGTCLSQ
jgi:hypothetical protein